MSKYLQEQIDQLRHEVRFLASQIGLQDGRARGLLARTVFAKVMPVGLEPSASKHARGVEGKGREDANEQSRPIRQPLTRTRG